MRLRFFLALLVTMAVSAAAHPHVFADVDVVAQFDKNGFVGVRNIWAFDDVYSAGVLATVGYAGENALSGDALKKIEASVLGPLEARNFLNYVQEGSAMLKAKGIRDFKVNVKGGKMVLDFVVAFSVPATADYTMLVVVVSDQTNYIQMTTDMEKADVAAPDGLEVEFFNDGLNGLTLFRGFRSDVEGLFLRYRTDR